MIDAKRNEYDSSFAAGERERESRAIRFTRTIPPGSLGLLEENRFEAFALQEPSRDQPAANDGDPPVVLHDAETPLTNSTSSSLISPGRSCWIQ